LDPTKYSIVFILYKNINYNDKYGINVARLDISTKKNMKNTLLKYNRFDFISDQIYIIGRKYIHCKDNTIRNNDCLSMICTYNMKKISSNDDYASDNLTQDTENTQDTQDADVLPHTKIDTKIDSKSILRRRFLNNVREIVTKVSDVSPSQIIRSAMFLDTEYTNDIYDTFETFPVSNDSSILFMIGVSFVKNNIVKYTNFTAKKLTTDEEMDILKDFLKLVKQRYTDSKIPPVLFHWSNADKYILQKTLARYPELQLTYQDIIDRIVYIDLLVVVKKTLNDLESYSLKYVSKHLLNISYTTDCKNGLDAMCSVIKSNVLLSQNKTKQKTLLCFENTKDVINYNKLDTTLLYHITKYFTN
jgi:hypothetical protein